MANVSRSFDAVESGLLNLLNDDLYGLWEVDWRFNGNHPERSSTERIALITSAVEKGCVSVFSGTTEGSSEVLPRNLAVDAVCKLANWSPPAADIAPTLWVTSDTQMLHDTGPA